MVPEAGPVGLLVWVAFAVHLAASSSLLRRGVSPRSNSVALLLSWSAPTCPPSVFRPLGGLQVAHYDGQEAGRRVVHVGELVAQPRQVLLTGIRGQHLLHVEAQSARAADHQP